MSLSDWWNEFKENRIKKKKIKEGTYVKPKIIHHKKEEPNLIPLITTSEKIQNRKVCNARDCRIKLNLANRHDCNYCGGYYCEKHRLPEEHGCKNPGPLWGIRKD